MHCITQALIVLAAFDLHVTCASCSFFLSFSSSFLPSFFFLFSFLFIRPSLFFCSFSFLLSFFCLSFLLQPLSSFSVFFFLPSSTPTCWKPALLLRFFLFLPDFFCGGMMVGALCARGREDVDGCPRGSALQSSFCVREVCVRPQMASKWRERAESATI